MLTAGERAPTVAGCPGSALGSSWGADSRAWHLTLKWISQGWGLELDL